MLEGIKILIQRIEANDKDIDDWIEKAQDDVLTEPDLSQGQVEQFTQEEKDAVRAALVAHYRREFNAEIMDMVSGKDETEEEEREPLSKKMLINQAQLQLMKAMAEQDAEFFAKAPVKKEGAWTQF